MDEINNQKSQQGEDENDIIETVAGLLSSFLTALGICLFFALLIAGVATLVTSDNRPTIEVFAIYFAIIFSVIFVLVVIFFIAYQLNDERVVNFFREYFKRKWQ